MQVGGLSAGDRRHMQGERLGAIAQLGERLLCTQEVSGSIPLSSTIPSWNVFVILWDERFFCR